MIKSELTVDFFTHKEYKYFMYFLQQLKIINSMNFTFENTVQHYSAFEMENFVPLYKEPKVFISFYTNNPEHE